MRRVSGREKKNLLLGACSLEAKCSISFDIERKKRLKEKKKPMQQPPPSGIRQSVLTASSGTAPMAVGRVILPVNFLTSVGISTAQCCAHFFLVSENESRLPPGKKPQKRLAILADRTTYQSDLDVAISRCVMFSQVTELSVLEEHLAPLIGPFSEFDILVQQSSTVDFIRTIAAVFKPNAAQVPTYVLEDGHVLTNRVHCRLVPNALQDVVGTVAQEASLRTLRTAKDRELLALQEALQKQKDEALLEMVDLHTQIETLKHSLSQTEQCLMSTRRAAKEEKELLLARLRQLEAEKDVRMGRAPALDAASPLPYNVSSGDAAPPYERDRAQSSAMRAPTYGTRPMSSDTPQPARGVSFAPTSGGATPNPYGPVSSTPMRAAPQSSGASGMRGNPPPGVRSPHSTLDQLQQQLSDGERFLLDLQKKNNRFP